MQNEPEASQTWESCLYTAEDTRDFVAQHLGPRLDADHPDVKVLGFDHNKDHIKDWADALLAEGSSSATYVDGIAFHWYSGSCFANVQAVSDAYPQTILLPSEACFELTVLEDDASDEAWLVNGTWSKGEGYGYDIWGDLESGSAGWTDWNILLDSNGGPNHVDNFCDAPVIAKIDVDVAAGEQPAIFFHPQYYYLGHFSKFLHPGSVRVQTQVVQAAGAGAGAAGVADGDDDCSWPYGGCNSDSLHVTSWLVGGEDDTDGKSDVSSTQHLAVIAMNCGDDDKVRSRLSSSSPTYGRQTIQHKSNNCSFPCIEVYNIKLEGLAVVIYFLNTISFVMA